MVYLPGMEGSAVDKLIADIGGPWMASSARGKEVKSQMMQRSNYSPMMRFALAVLRRAVRIRLINPVLIFGRNRDGAFQPEVFGSPDTGLIGAGFGSRRWREFWNCCRPDRNRGHARDSGRGIECGRSNGRGNDCSGRRRSRGRRIGSGQRIEGARRKRDEQKNTKCDEHFHGAACVARSASSICWIT